ncbi:hypothetical protein D9M68_247130 [compost metagenome]
MGIHRLSTLIALSLPLLLAGCATSSNCDSPSERCQAQRLLYQNDMLQARMLISSGQQENFDLANALLDRAMPLDRRGEASFYKALLLIRQGGPTDEVLDLLERSAKAGQPYATVLLFRIYSEPYLIPNADRNRAERYRMAYAQLPVAISGYPSFDKARTLVDGLLAGQPAMDSSSAGR